MRNHEISTLKKYIQNSAITLVKGKELDTVFSFPQKIQEN